MTKVNILNSNINSLKNNIQIYQEEIDQIKAKIDQVVKMMKENQKMDDTIWDTMLSYSLSDFSSLEKNLLSVEYLDVGDDIIDYSVTMSDLTLMKTINVNGKTVNIYKSRKTDAIYVISNGLNSNERKKLKSELKNHLSDNQMAIVTFNGDTYKYDITNKNNCTRDYEVVGKTDQGKMYSFTTRANSEIVVDDGHMNDSDTLMTSINGMIVENHMTVTMEKGTVLKMQVRPQRNLQGGQVVTEFERLSFSGGVHESIGSEYASVYMEGDWQKYANTRENKENGTWINENNNRNVVVIGKGPEKDYPKKYYTVGHVDTDVIPVIIEAGNKAGEQHMQGTVCYHHDGNRAGYTSKDMLAFNQVVVSDWYNL